MTYFFMLLFVFITLFAISVRWLGLGGDDQGSTTRLMADAVLALLWAALGTFFFYNIW